MPKKKELEVEMMPLEELVMMPLENTYISFLQKTRVSGYCPEDYTTIAYPAGTFAFVVS